MAATADDDGDVVGLWTSASPASSSNESSARTTVGWIEPVQRDPVMARIELAILAAMLTVSVLGNMLALLALKMRHRKLSRMHFFFVHLCVADLVVAVFHILSQLVLDAIGGFPDGNGQGFVGDRALCKIVMYLQMLGPYSSSYVLAVTAIDRYQAICFPLSNCSWTPRRSQAMVGGAWLLAAIVDLPQLFVFDYYYGEYGRYDCYANFAHPPWGERIYVLCVTLAIFIMPFIIIVYTYTYICRVIWVNFRQKSNHAADRQQSQRQVVDEKNDSKDGGGGAIDVQRVNVVVGGAYRFKGKCKVEVTLCHSASNQVRGRALSSVHPRTHSVSGISRAKMKTIKVTVVVIVCYVACYSPFYSSMLYVTWYPEARHFAFYSSPAFTICALLASLNSCVNPWLYLTFNENLTKTLKDLFCCRRRRRYGAAGGTENFKNAANDQVNAFSRSSISETKSYATQHGRQVQVPTSSGGHHSVHYRPGTSSSDQDDVEKIANRLDVIGDDRAPLTDEDDVDAGEQCLCANPMERPESTGSTSQAVGDAEKSCSTISLQTASSALNLNCCHLSTSPSECRRTSVDPKRLHGTTADGPQDGANYLPPCTRTPTREPKCKQTGRASNYAGVHRLSLS